METNATSWPVDTQPEPLQSGAYTCVVTDANGNQIITNPANLTVTPPPTPPSITAHPIDRNATVGSSVSFTVEANGTAPLLISGRRIILIYRERPISTLLLNNIQLIDNNSTYRVLISNSAGNLTSNEARLNVRLPNNLNEFNNGLVAHYPFDGNANDSSGRNNHAVIVGGAGFETARSANFGNALRLDGINDYARVTPANDFNLMRTPPALPYQADKNQ